MQGDRLAGYRLKVASRCRAGILWPYAGQGEEFGIGPEKSFPNSSKCPA